jgi:PBP1b-binding outer membrane lipoprotein LpoB
MNKLAAIIITAALLSACASQPAKISQTASGWPEIEISVSDKKLVKDYIVLKNSEAGWNMEQESDSMVTFSKVDSSGSFNAAFTQVALGNAYSTPPKYEVKYFINQLSGRVKVVSNIAVSTQMPGGQVNRVFLNENNAVYNAYQDQLVRFKQGIEKSR